jgi:hypothetical protein
MADRKFAEWDWTDGNARATVEVRVKWGGEGYDLNSIVRAAPVFYVKSASPYVKAESGDLAALAAMVTAQLAAFYVLTWEPMLVIETGYGEREGRDDTRTRLSIDFEEWEHAESPQGPRWRHRLGSEYRYVKGQAPDGTILRDTQENREKIAACERAIKAAAGMVEEALK